MAALIAQLWPDASQDPESDLFSLLRLANKSHSGPWTSTLQDYKLPAALERVLHCRISCQLDAHSSLIAAALAVLLIATAAEEFGVPECTTTLEAAALCGPHRWGIILPNSSRVSMLTYQAIVAVRYPELVLHEPNHIYIGHFVPHESTVTQEGSGQCCGMHLKISELLLRMLLPSAPT